MMRTTGNFNSGCGGPTAAVGFDDAVLADVALTDIALTTPDFATVGPHQPVVDPSALPPPAPVPQRYVGAVEAAMKIVRLLSRSGTPLGVAAIAKGAGANPSTAYNILKTLQKEGVVAFDSSTKTYALGLAVLEVAAPLLGRSPAELIRPLLIDLAEAHRMAVALWLVLPNDRIVLGERVAPTHVVRAELRPGARLPILAGAVGRCIAARLGLSKAQARRKFAQVRWQNAPQFDQFWDDVAAARTDGYAFDYGQLFAGLHTTGTLVCNREGQPVYGIGAISIVGQTPDSQLRAAAIALREAAKTIERNLYGPAGAVPESAPSAPPSTSETKRG